LTDRWNEVSLTDVRGMSVRPSRIVMQFGVMNRATGRRACAVIVVALAAITAFAATAGQASAPTEQLLVVSSGLPSFRPVAHVYDGAGHLMSTVAARSGGTSLTWSPDGSLLAVADHTGVSVERADGSGQRRLVSIKTLCTRTCLAMPAVSWTPDSKRLAIGGIDPQTTGFDLVDAGSGRIVPFRRPRANVRYVPIAFSPNGRSLAYTLSRGDFGTSSCCLTALIVARSDGTQPRILHRFGDPIHDGPGAATWSPDSTRIAFTDDGRDPKDPRLAIVDVRGSGTLHALDPRNVYDQSPAWSPDGTRLALTQYKGPAFTISADGTHFRSLAVNGTAALWLRNGDLLLTKGSSAHSVSILRHSAEPAHTLFTLPNHEQLLSIQEKR